MHKKINTLLALVIFTAFHSMTPQTAIAKNKLQGSVKVDGSSTVFPVSEAMAEEFLREHSRVRVTVGLSGTGGGFKKFTKNEIDITGASRPIKSSELKMAKTGNVQFIEFPVAYDGIVLVVSKKNTWAQNLTTTQLQSMWEMKSTINLWSDINSAWPKKKINFYTPGADSGTFDYFTKAINKKSKSIRNTNITASEDDNVLVQGVAGDPYAIGYFGYAYYAENKKRLNVVAVDAGKGPITPNAQTIESGSYAPLSRPIFIYVNKASLAKPQVRSFVGFYLKQAATLAPQVGYVALPKEQYQASLKQLNTILTK